MNLVNQICLFSSFLLLIPGCGRTDLPENDAIRFSQLGFYPAERKIAVFTGEDLITDFKVRDLDKNKIVYSSKARIPETTTFSGKKTYVLEFSRVTSPGKYQIELPRLCKSVMFEIKPHVLDDIARAAIKAFYYQRTATPVEPEYAGVWSRGIAHMDDSILIHPSAISRGRPAGTVLSSSKGWYDAGDYNKYIVNSGFTVGVLLSLYEDYPEQIKKLDTNIPESKNQTPDLLDEVYWNLDWMLTMQDPSDGGVYHKLTTPGFEGFIKPEDCRKPKYVVARSVTATLDFAASMAQAARIYKSYETDYPGFAGKALLAAKKAFAWAEANPDALYNQRKMNEQYKPEITTGEYGDRSAKDEFFWAAAELYSTTKDSKYLEVLKENLPGQFVLPVWSNIASLGVFSLIRLQQELASPDITPLIVSLEEMLTGYAANLVNGVEESPYNAPYGMREKDFFWGCNSDAASSQGITLLYAWKITKDRNYLENALKNLEYILGRNATGYCYITGYGHKSPMNPHHRLAATDDIIEPIPGFLVGGPNPGRQDGCTYPSDVADECYADIVASYASNEVAINWQAMFSYFVSALGYNLE